MANGIFSNEKYTFKGQSKEVIITFLISSAFFILLQPITSFFIRLFVPAFAKWEKKKQRDWTSRMVSNVHAVIFCAAAVYFMFISQDIYVPLIEDGSLDPGSKYALPLISFSMAYFAVDMYYVLKYFNNDKLTVLHHLGAGIAAFFITGYELGAIYMLVFGITEASTPFVNLRVFLSDLGKRDGLFYVVNGFLMWFCFLVFRIPTIFYIPYLVIRYNWNALIHEGTYAMLVVISFGYLAISFLNVWWFYLISKGLLKAISQNNKKKN